ncbi:conserved hypothetical protein [Candidatus Methylobacter favarea]|uniref:Uncharacterized protein n=1 Tax=Candidatus Methylobacter favarea TaxID=2707345 RepID=A0A8S0X9A0_9GAMM|nr:hypothetical protein [Candidatus Methylobacter favarea]CAA9892036.1 conserved hypothetical protein [Candidatus Methylobacter favarea]
MTKQLILILSIILVLGSVPMSEVFADSNSDFSELNFTRGIGFDSKLDWPHPFTVKKEESYDEAKDPLFRKGTENVEESQVSFFVIPAVMIGIILVFMLFNRE